MYYWDLGNIKHASLKAQEIIEDIFLIVNGEWDFTEKKATQKMMNLFKDKDGVIREIMEMKLAVDPPQSIDDLIRLMAPLSTKETAKPDKIIDIPKQPEELFAEVQHKYGHHIGKRMENGKEEMDTLAVFVTQMAVYKFCEFHLPYLLSLADVEDLRAYRSEWEDYQKEEMEEWERLVWTVWVSHSIEVRFSEYEDMFSKKKKLKDKYANDYNRDYTEVYACIARAFEDGETVQAVKEMQNQYSGDVTYDSCKDSIKEIQSMRHLLDIMERSIKGGLTEQDKAEVKDKAEEWGRDIETLTKMLNKSSM